MHPNFFFFFNFGCANSSLWHVGFSSWACFCCRAWAQQLWLMDFSSYGMWVLLPRSTWDLSLLIMDGTCVLYTKRWILNHWTTKEVPMHPNVAPFTIAKTWKQPICPLTDEWIKKIWYIYTMEYHSTIKTRMK